MSANKLVVITLSFVAIGAGLYAARGRLSALPSSLSLSAAQVKLELAREERASVPVVTANTKVPSSAGTAVTTDEVDSFSRSRRAVFDHDPVLARVKQLTEKVLRTTEEERELGEHLSDRDALRRQFEVLSGKGETNRDETVELHRMYAIDFVGYALSWENNPARDHVKSLALSALGKELPTNTPKDLQRSLAADRTELIGLLVEHAPNDATALRESVKGTRLENLYERATARIVALGKR